MEIFVVAVLLGLIPASIASGKGRSFLVWWLYGALLFIVALPMALIMKPKEAAPQTAESTGANVKSRPDNYVPGWLVLVVFIALGGFIWFKATDSGTISPAPTQPTAPQAAAGLSAKANSTPKNTTSSKQAGLRWIYDVSTDKLSGKKTSTATVKSINSLDLDFPYSGNNYGHLIVRQHPQYGLGVIVTVDKGQILCDVYTCKLKIRFDDGSVQDFTMAPSDDHSSTVVFAKHPSWAIKHLGKAKKILVQVPMFQEGNQVLTFQVREPLVWPPR